MREQHRCWPPAITPHAVWLAWFMLLHGAAQAQAGEPARSGAAPAARRVLVQRIAAVGVERSLARSVEEALILDLGDRSDVAVVSPAELEQTVALAREHAEFGCDALEQCLVEVQRKLKVRWVISGKVSRLGPDLILALGLIDLHASAVQRRVARQAGRGAGLLTQLHAAADELLGQAPPRQPFRLAGDEPLKLAVMPLSARGVPPATADAMTQILSAELNQIQNVSVISRDDIAAILDKVQLEGELGCTDNMACIVEIGAALGLAKLVTGTVGRVQRTYVVSMQLVDTRKAEVENRVLESFDGDADELKHVVKLGAHRIVGVDDRARVGHVDFSFDVPELDVRLGQGPRRPLRQGRLELHNLQPGRYSLDARADADDYEPLRTDVYVAPGSYSVRSFTLRAREAPWYSQWWVWAIAGAAVLGSTTAAVLIAQEPPDSQPGRAVLP